MAARKPPAGTIPGEHQFLDIRDIEGVYTQAARTALTPKQASWLENLIPLGPGNLKTVPGPAPILSTIASGITLVRWGQAALNGIDWLIGFCSDGSAVGVNLADGTQTAIGAAGTFTTPDFDQWEGAKIIICDPTKGVFSWDGTTLLPYASAVGSVTVTGGGAGYTSVPTVTFGAPAVAGGIRATGTAIISGGVVTSVLVDKGGMGYVTAPAITFSASGSTTGATAAATLSPIAGGDTLAVYQSYVWIGKGRAITNSAPGDPKDFSPATGSGTTTLTEPYLKKAITRLRNYGGYLYVFSDASVLVITSVDTAGSPPITKFGHTTLSGSVGTTFFYGTTEYNRVVMMATQAGVFAIFGASVEPISEGLNGVLSDVDFTKPVSVGVVNILNTLCFCISFWYAPASSVARNLLALYFKGRWFFVSQMDAATLITPVHLDGNQRLYLTDGNGIQQALADPSVAVAWKVETALLPEGNPILTKQVIRSGLEIDSGTAEIAFYTQTEVGGNLVTLNAGVFVWTAGVVVYAWTSSGAPFIWNVSALQLLQTANSAFGKYLGFFASAKSKKTSIIGFLSEYVNRERW